MLLASLFALPVAADQVDFNREVRPLLSKYCFQCHGPDAQHREADLRLDVESAAKRSAIHPGDVQSELLLRITSEDQDTIMPPPETGKALNTAEIELLRTWIQQGAPWQEHWAYVRPREHPIPECDSDWPANWIDHFILEAQQAARVLPSPAADDITIVRRLYFDLIGLPPTPQQVEAFLQTDQDNAYERLVDSLLESDHFGERIAMYWLDLVRYADTVGYHGDQDHAISPYRDYVIDAINRDLPFDQFTLEQLAGDLLPDSTIDQRIATGYNRLLQTSHEGGVQPQEYLAIYAADRVRNVSAVWLGGTLGCAQCHDHKYDPYTAKDFYSMAAFFADIDEAGHFTEGSNSLPTARPPEMDVLSHQDRERLAQIDERLEVPESLDDDEKSELKAEKLQIEKRRRRTMVTVALEKPRTIRLLPRGNWLDDSGPVMSPAVPEFLGNLERDLPTRLDLARWLTSVDGVGLLTSRVMVNRLWYLCMGRGISSSLDDFGAQGRPPTHPELLDNLAIAFVRDGWSLKRLLKLIVMSQTYRQSSAIRRDLLISDPENSLFARQQRYRLPAEIIRDAALSTSGLLIRHVGGASVKPYQPRGYYRHLNFPKRRYSAHADERQWRRGVYVHWQRQFLHPMLRAFDAPSREECTAVRSVSNTPLSALVLMNDPTFVEAARSLAQVAAEEHESDEQRIVWMFQQAVSRSPTAYEAQVLRQLLDDARREYRIDESAAEALLAVGELSVSEGDSRELASWTAVARTLLNLHEFTTRR